MNKSIISLTLFSVMLSCIVATASADEFHYTNLLVGDRATGMGGAYTAVSDDATGLYYNPAGVAYAAGNNFSASVNAFYNNEKTYKGAIDGNGWTRKSSSLLPNYFGVVQPVGRFKVGLSYAVPDSIMEDQQQTYANLPLSSTSSNPGTNISSYTINFNDEYNVYNFGPSIAMEVTDNFSAGLTLYYYQKTQLWILNQLINTSNGGYQLSNEYYHSNEWGVRPVLGFMLSPMNAVSVGLAVSKILVVGSNTNDSGALIQQSIPLQSNGAGFLKPPATTARREYPTQVSLGVAWFPTPGLLISGDIKYFTEVKNMQDFNMSWRAEPVTDVAFGTEYYFNKNWAMRAGFYTDMSNAPNIVPGEMNDPEHINLYGGTASISSFTRNTSVTLGGGVTAGEGKAQIITNSTDIQTLVSRGWTLFISSTYSY
jgi:long-chain fatty acid transport protein